MSEMQNKHECCEENTEAVVCLNEDFSDDGLINIGCCSERHKKRTEEEQKALITRLRKAEGQIRGIIKMVENDAYCPDILIQISAVNSALNSFNKELLACHIRSCVTADIREGNDDAIDEFVKVLQKLMK